MGIDTCIIIPIYKQSDFLPNTLNSIVDKNVMTLCVLDGEPDFYMRRLINYFEKKIHSPIIFIKKGHSGLSDTRNFGVQYVIENFTNINYFLFLDSDDMYFPGSITKMINSIHQYNDKSIFVYPSIQHFGIRDAYWTPYRGFHRPYAHLFRNNIPYSILIPVSTFKERNLWYEVVPGVNEFSEDWNFSLKLIENGFKPVLCEDATLHYRNRENSMAVRTSKKLNKDFDRNRKLLPNLYKSKNLESNRIKEIEFDTNNNNLIKLSNFIEIVFKKNMVRSGNYKLNQESEVKMNAVIEKLTPAHLGVLWSLLWISRDAFVDMAQDKIKIEFGNKVLNLKINNRFFQGPEMCKKPKTKEEENHEENLMLKYNKFNYMPKELHHRNSIERKNLKVSHSFRPISQLKSRNSDHLYYIIGKGVRGNIMGDTHTYFALSTETLIEKLIILAQHYDTVQVRLELLITLFILRPKRMALFFKQYRQKIKHRAS